MWFSFFHNRMSSGWSWAHLRAGRMLDLGLWADRRGAIAVMFALSALPLVAMVGLAIDYSYFIQARSQLNLAADAAAMHAVRVAAQDYASGYTSAQAQAAATQAGQQWFTAQLGSMVTATVGAPNVTVTYTAAPSGFSALVTASGTVPNAFGRIFNVATWPIASSSTAVVSNSYVEVVMLLDNSPSMLIGSTITDIVAMEQATMCSTQSATAYQDMSNYTWNYTSHSPAYGFVSGDVSPPAPATSSSPAAANGSCDSNYTGDPSACFYPIYWASNRKNINSSGQCVNASGIPYGGASTSLGPNTPQAPCAFACHNDPLNNDYYGLARSIGVTLRLDVIQSAAANVISTMASKQQSPNQFSVGVYQFATNLAPLYPGTGLGEASTNLSAALTVVQNVHNTPALTLSNGQDTDFTNSINQLNALVTPAGNGQTQAAPLKNLFIVTDGMNDSPLTQAVGPMTSASNETLCQQFKNKGYNVYVLYTPYLPLPNQFYLYQRNIRYYAEPTNTSPLVAAMTACASSAANFFLASSPADINAAMQAMLNSALNAPARVAY